MVRYQTKPCPGMVNDSFPDYGEMTITLAHLTKGELTEEHMVELMKEERTKQQTLKNYAAKDPKDSQLTGTRGNIPVRYIDETYEVNGKEISSRFYYFFQETGMISIRISINGYKPVENNKFYQACMQSIVVIQNAEK